jgi:hypothetical protein
MGSKEVPVSNPLGYAQALQQQQQQHQAAVSSSSSSLHQPQQAVMQQTIQQQQPQQQQKQQLLTDLVAGMVTSGIYTSLTYPVHRVKILLQTQDANPRILSGVHCNSSSSSSSSSRDQLLCYTLCVP